MKITKTMMIILLILFAGLGYNFGEAVLSKVLIFTPMKIARNNTDLVALLYHLSKNRYIINLFSAIIFWNFGFTILYLVKTKD